MAGPCSVESEKTDHAGGGGRGERPARKCCAAARFKPRTSPYDFQGMEEEGLKLLQKAKQTTGLEIVLQK